VINLKEKHGIDYVFQYKSSLRDSTKQEVLISVKCRDGYPTRDEAILKNLKSFWLISHGQWSAIHLVKLLKDGFKILLKR
jgi:hypothetical protein